jgi:protein TonB
MSDRYVTHLVAVVFFHLILLFGGWKFFETQFNPKLRLGPPVITMKFATEVLTPKVIAAQEEQPRPRPLPKQAARPTERPEVSPQPESSLSAMAQADLRDLFKEELRARIDQNKFYPVVSRRLGQTGIVVVAFTLLSDGNIINVRIESPSPYERLNEAGLEAVKKVHRFKPIPPELGTEQMDIRIPVKFFTI